MSPAVQSIIGRLKAEDVALLMETGRALSSGSFLLKYLKKGQTEPFYIGFIAPKKVFKTAVLRNQAKRRGRAIFQGFYKENPEISAKKGLFLAFILRPQVLKSEFAEVKAELSQIIKKALY